MHRVRWRRDPRGARLPDRPVPQRRHQRPDRRLRRLAPEPVPVPGGSDPGGDLRRRARAGGRPPLARHRPPRRVRLGPAPAGADRDRAAQRASAGVRGAARVPARDPAAVRCVRADGVGAAR